MFYLLFLASNHFLFHIFYLLSSLCCILCDLIFSSSGFNLLFNQSICFFFNNCIFIYRSSSKRNFWLFLLAYCCWLISVTASFMSLNISYIPILYYVFEKSYIFNHCGDKNLLYAASGSWWLALAYCQIIA